MDLADKMSCDKLLAACAFAKSIALDMRRHADKVDQDVLSRYCTRLVERALGKFVAALLPVSILIKIIRSHLTIAFKKAS